MNIIQLNVHQLKTVLLKPYIYSHLPITSPHFPQRLKKESFDEREERNLKGLVVTFVCRGVGERLKYSNASRRREGGEEVKERQQGAKLGARVERMCFFSSKQKRFTEYI